MTNSKRKPIVAGTDGSASAVQAVRWAARAARLRDRALHVVTTYQVPVAGYPEGLVIAQDLRTELAAQATKDLAAAELAAAEAAPGVAVTTQAAEASTQATLRTLSETAELLVIGSRGLGGFTGLLLGSNATGLAARASCPVVVVRGDQLVESTGPVVVGVDGTPVGEPAIALAFEEASLRGAELVAVHAWQEDAVDIALRANLFEAYWDAAIEHATALISERLAGWREKYPDVPVHPEVSTDSAAKTLVWLSETAQLVVVGSRGRGGFAGLTLGSTSQSVIRHASAPVVVVRTPKGTDG